MLFLHKIDRTSRNVSILLDLSFNSGMRHLVTHTPFLTIDLSWYDSNQNELQFRKKTVWSWKRRLAFVRFISNCAVMFLFSKGRPNFVGSGHSILAGHPPTDFLLCRGLSKNDLLVMHENGHMLFLENSCPFTKWSQNIKFTEREGLNSWRKMNYLFFWFWSANEH